MFYITSSSCKTCIQISQALLHFYGYWLTSLSQALEDKSNAQIKNSTFSNSIGEDGNMIDDDIREIFMIFEVR